MKICGVEIFDEAAQAKVRDDADHRHAAFGKRLSDEELPAECALTWPHLAGQLFVNDHHRVRGILACVEEATFNEPHANRFEEAGRDRTSVGFRRAAGVRQRIAAVGQAPVGQIVERKMTDGADAGHPGNNRQVSLQFVGGRLAADPLDTGSRGTRRERSGGTRRGTRDRRGALR